MRRSSLPTPLGEKLQSQQPVEVLTRCITIGAGEAATKIKLITNHWSAAKGNKATLKPQGTHVTKHVSGSKLLPPPTSCW